MKRTFEDTLNETFAESLICELDLSLVTKPFIDHFVKTCKSISNSQNSSQNCAHKSVHKSSHIVFIQLYKKFFHKNLTKYTNRIKKVMKEYNHLKNVHYNDFWKLFFDNIYELKNTMKQILCNQIKQNEYYNKQIDNIIQETKNECKHILKECERMPDKSLPTDFISYVQKCETSEYLTKSNIEYFFQHQSECRHDLFQQLHEFYHEYTSIVQEKINDEKYTEDGKALYSMIYQILIQKNENIDLNEANIFYSQESAFFVICIEYGQVLDDNVNFLLSENLIHNFSNSRKKYVTWTDDLQVFYNDIQYNSTFENPEIHILDECYTIKECLQKIQDYCFIFQSYDYGCNQYTFNIAEEFELYKECVLKFKGYTRVQEYWYKNYEEILYLHNNLKKLNIENAYESFRQGHLDQEEYNEMYMDYWKKHNKLKNFQNQIEKNDILTELYVKLINSEN